MNDSTLSRVRFGPPRPRSRDSFHILSWNLNRGLEYPKILEFLRTTQADLLLLQEVDLNARRTGFRDSGPREGCCAVDPWNSDAPGVRQDLHARNEST